MYYRVGGVLAEDHGSAWARTPSGERIQRADLRPELLLPDPRVVSVGGETIVDDAMAAALRALMPDSVLGLRPAIAIGPQPDLTLRTQMIQLVPSHGVRVVEQCVRRDPEGRHVGLRPPIIS